MDKSKDYKNYKAEPVNYVGSTFTAFIHAAAIENIKEVVGLRDYLMALKKSGAVKDGSHTVKYAEDTVKWLNEVIKERTNEGN